MKHPQWLYDPGDAEKIAQHERDRIESGVSFYDWINLDHFLANTIVNSMQRSIDNRTGHPAEMTDEEWNNILVAIRDGFQSYLDLDTLASKYYDEGKYDHDRAIADDNAVMAGVRESFRLLGQHFDSLWD